MLSPSTSSVPDLLHAFCSDDAYRLMKVPDIHWARDRDSLEDEPRMLRHVHDMLPDHPGHQNTAPKLIDVFDLDFSCYSPRPCWVMPVYGPSIYGAACALGAPDEWTGFTYSFTKRNARMLLQALTYLHDVCKVVHGSKYPTYLSLTLLQQSDSS